MKKYLFPAMFLFLIAIAFSGTVSAESTIDTYYINEDGDEITTAQVNDNIEYLTEVQNDGTPVDDATVSIDVNSNIYWVITLHTNHWMVEQPGLKTHHL